MPISAVLAAFPAHLMVLASFLLPLSGRPRSPEINRGSFFFFSKSVLTFKASMSAESNCVH